MEGSTLQMDSNACSLKGATQMSNFEVFKGRASPTPREAALTIYPRGLFSVNRAAWNALGEPAAVELLFDRTERLIGLRGAPAQVPHAYPLRTQAASSSVLVSGRAFTRHYGIPTDVARRYPARMVGDVLAADVKEGTATGRHALGEEAR
jgi:hypothetical protein